jgi:hypothetical protein
LNIRRRNFYVKEEEEKRGNPLGAVGSEWSPLRKLEMRIIRGGEIGG